MPSRLLRERITTSESLDALSAEAERLFYRLLVVSDDYGRFEAMSQIIIAKTFPRRVGEEGARAVTKASINAWLEELARANVIQLYTVKGREYGAFINWSEYNAIRNKNSKFPAPDDSCEDLQTIESKCKQMRPNTDSDTNANTETIKGASGGPLAVLAFLPETFQTAEMREACERYERHRKERRHPTWKASTIESNAKHWAKFEPGEVIEAIDMAIRGNWQGVFPENVRRKRKGDGGTVDTLNHNPFNGGSNAA